MKQNINTFIKSHVEWCGIGYRRPWVTEGYCHGAIYAPKDSRALYWLKMPDGKVSWRWSRAAHWKIVEKMNSKFIH